MWGTIRKLLVGKTRLVELFGFDADVLLAGLALLPVFAHPGFVRSSGGGVAATEGQRGDIGIGDGDALVAVSGKDADERIGQSLSRAAIEDVALEFAAVLAGDGHVAAVVEGLFQGLADFFFGSEFGDPALKVLVGGAGGDFLGVGTLLKNRASGRHLSG